MYDKKAGTIKETEDGYEFIYTENYLMDKDALPISLTLPLQKQPYKSKTFFPFFDGLIPEGWLLNIAIKKWNLNSYDRMGLLMTTCKDCIGAVSVVADEI
ncbi:MAG: HipA N-terminal domain-containing protein [Spirochaetia bacterium]|jgi:serine/threonine-protein kinase HipA|nr:HipA N-terminal domain-containing protein [Spirochaetia bacterium]